MTDATQAEATPTEAPKASSIFKVPVTKGKATLDVDMDRLPDAVYREVILQGMKVVLNRGMTKITKETYPNADELKAAAIAKASETVEAMYAGKIRIMGAKAEKTSGAVMTEARRLARNLVKDELKRQKVKISYVEASEITKAANALIAADPSIIKAAEESLKARDAKSAGIKEKLAGLVQAVPQSEAKKKKAEADKAKAKEQLSATQAKLTAKSKPGTQPQA